MVGEGQADVSMLLKWGNTASRSAEWGWMVVWYGDGGEGGGGLVIVLVVVK